MREIKFRAWDKIKQRWCLCEELMWCISSNPFTSGGGIFELDESNRERDSAWNIGTSYDLMQFTGLLDKNGLTEIYEGDIIDIDGNIIGNQYENEKLLKEKTNLIIQGFGTKDWGATYKEAMGRGCQNAQ